MAEKINFEIIFLLIQNSCKSCKNNFAHVKYPKYWYKIIKTWNKNFGFHTPTSTVQSCVNKNKNAHAEFILAHCWFHGQVSCSLGSRMTSNFRYTRKNERICSFLGGESLLLLAVSYFVVFFSFFTKLISLTWLIHKLLLPTNWNLDKN